MQQQALADFARQVAALEDRADRAAAQFVELLGGHAELAAFANGDHEGGGFQRFGANAFYNQFHFRVPYKGLRAMRLYAGFNAGQLCKPPATKAAV